VRRPSGSVTHDRVTHTRVTHTRVTHTRVTHTRVTHTRVTHTRVTHTRVTHPIHQTHPLSIKHHRYIRCTPSRASTKTHACFDCLTPAGPSQSLSLSIAVLDFNFDLSPPGTIFFWPGCRSVFGYKGASQSSSVARPSWLLASMGATLRCTARGHITRSVL
jgi:hypothetical protein